MDEKVSENNFNNLEIIIFRIEYIQNVRLNEIYSSVVQIN